MSRRKKRWTLTLLWLIICDKHLKELLWSDKQTAVMAKCYLLSFFMALLYQRQYLKRRGCWKGTWICCSRRQSERRARCQQRNQDQRDSPSSWVDCSPPGWAVYWRGFAYILVALGYTCSCSCEEKAAGWHMGLSANLCPKGYVNLNERWRISRHHECRGKPTKRPSIGPSRHGSTATFTGGAPTHVVEVGVSRSRSRSRRGRGYQRRRQCRRYHHVCILPWQPLDLRCWLWGRDTVHKFCHTHNSTLAMANFHAFCEFVQFFRIQVFVDHTH